MIHDSMQVEVTQMVTPDKERCLLKVMVDLHPDVLVPYDSLYSALRFLYGSSCHITFDLTRYETK